MPIYEYRCRKCGEVFERFMKVNERGDSLTCPYCGEKKPEKILSSFSSSKGADSSSSCGPTGGSTRFTPLESPAASSGDGDKIPFGANTGFKAPREPSRWKVRDLLTGFT